MKTDHTALVLMKDGLYEYPLSKPKRLGDEFKDLADRMNLVVEMVNIGLEPRWNEGVVYAYIENRHKEFRHPYYGWALPR